MVQQLVICRSPHMGDLEEIVQINRLALPENYPVGYFIQLLKDCKSASVVAEIDGNVVGYIITRIEKFSLTGFLTGKYPRGHIISVAVHPEYRRLGIGYQMMNYVVSKLKSMKSIKEVTLEVRVSNEPAIALYRKLGFKVDKVLEKYYKDGEPANLMKLRLQ